MLVLTPALGVPSEEMLQDTLKSIIVSMFAFGTGIFFFWQQQRRNPSSKLIWHNLMWLPISLSIYALGSMLWSHAYLGGVEAARWLVFSLLMWLCMNTRLQDVEDRILWGVHWGVTVASFWTAWQFWGDFQFFPQSYNPSSTFINRNIFAEYAVCALPYSVYLLLRTRNLAETLTMAGTVGFNVVAIMMAGTRSALAALLVLCAVVGLMLYRNAREFQVLQRGFRTNASILAVFLLALIGFGSIPTSNASLIAEFGPNNAISRTLERSVSVAKSAEYTTGSFSARIKMWEATSRMISANWLSGVGAGAWEVEIPLYQSAGTQTETDYYAHNESLQLIAEYGAVGLLFLVLLLSYLSISAWQTWTNRSPTINAVAPIKMAALASLLMLLVVSNAGFPWRMAGTSALFAIGLAILSATDAQTNSDDKWLLRYCSCRTSVARLATFVLSLGLVLTLSISFISAVVEKKLVRSLKLAISISHSQEPTSPRWDSTRVEMLNLTGQAIAINPHYRKLTAMIGDELARSGDWGNALWVWESVLESRPHIVALISNIARAHMELGNLPMANAYFDKAKSLQPLAPSVTSLGVELLVNSGQLPTAVEHVKLLIEQKQPDYNILRLAYQIGKKTHNWPLVLRALEIRIQHWPREATEAWLKIGDVLVQNPEVFDEEKALKAYQAALAASPERYKKGTLERIPQAYRTRLVQSF